MRFIIFLLATLPLWSCCSSKKANQEECNLHGTVRDFSGLDGCGLLIELDNGDLLNPAVLPEGVSLRNGQRISFSYKVLPDRVSICMSEKAIVEITCLKEFRSGQTGCTDTENPFEVPWMDRAFDLHNPVQILKFTAGQEARYLFRAVGEEWLYDCHGTLVCHGKGNNEDPCRKNEILPLGKGKIIWQGEGVWD